MIAHDVFISYSHVDHRIANRLTTSLRDAGFVVFIDEDIAAGEPIMSAIDARVAEASAVVVLWSDASSRSGYVQGEIMAARDRGTLVPVLIDDSPISTFVRSLRFRRLVSDGTWDERAFQDLRRDLAARCGRSRSCASDSSAATIDRRADTAAPADAHPLRIAIGLERASAGCPPPAASALQRVISVVEHLQPIAEVSSEVRSRVLALTGLRPDDPLTAIADLSLSRMQTGFLVLLADRVVYAGAGGRASIDYSDVVTAPIQLIKNGYGLSAHIVIADATLTVTGSVQTNALLEILYAIREELSWLSTP